MRLIDADELIERIKPYDTDDYAEKALYNFALNNIICCPTVQVIKQGYWIKDSYLHRCSECGYATCGTDDEGDYIPNNYCPNCGADMRGTE